MTDKELKSFVKNYTTDDFIKIKFDWNKKYGEGFEDKNLNFRTKICELIKKDFSYSSDKIIIDLFLELSKCAVESFGVYQGYHLFANELLERGGVNYLNFYTDGAMRSMDTFLSSSKLDLSKKRTLEILFFLESKSSDDCLNMNPKTYEAMVRRFSILAEKLIENKDYYKDLEPYLSCKDYTVSNEVYQVMLNKEFDMLVTTPVPKNLGDYYKSEDYISHTDSKKSLFDKVYQNVKNITLKRKLKLINSFNVSSKNILDVGAGTGDFLKVCKQNSWNVFGTEPSLDARTIAARKEIQLKENLSAYKNQQFDVITLWHVLEHVENLSKYIVELNTLLKDDGRLLIAVPNFKSFDAKYYNEHWAAFDVPRHLWHFSQNSIHKLFGLVNMKVEKTLPMKFDAFYVSLLSEKYKTGRRNPFSAFLTGLKSNWKAKSTKEYSSLIYVLKKH